MNDRKTLIQIKLQEAFNPTYLEVSDDSHLHLGHPGAKSGGGHYTVTITSPSFTGKSLLERHRLIYQALGDMMQQAIHALKIIANAPS